MNINTDLSHALADESAGGFSPTHTYRGEPCEIARQDLGHALIARSLEERGGGLLVPMAELDGTDKTHLFTVTLRECWVQAFFPAEGLPTYDDLENATGLKVEAHDGDQGACDSATCCYLVRAESADEIRTALAKWRDEVLADCDDADDSQDSAAALAGALDRPEVVAAKDGDRWAEQGVVRAGRLVDDDGVLGVEG